MRCQLDGLALRHSIELGDNQWEEKLVVFHHRLSRGISEDVDQWESLHKAFHMCLLEACNLPILLSYCDQLYDQNIRYRFLAKTSVDYSSRDVRKEHQDILNATFNRNANLASDLLLEHYSKTGCFLAATSC